MDILQNKDDLCKCLSSDPSYIIEKAENILSVKEYRNLHNISDDHEKIGAFLAIIIEGNHCQKFIQILKDEQNHYPELSKLFKDRSPGACHLSVCADDGSTAVTPVIANTSLQAVNMDLTLQAFSHAHSRHQPGPLGPRQPDVSEHKNVLSTVSATQGSNVVAPVIHNATLYGDFNLNFRSQPARRSSAEASKPAEESGTFTGDRLRLSAVERSASIPDKQEFLRNNFSKLVEKVKNVDKILDDLISKRHSQEMVDNARVKTTPRNKMRQILTSTSSKKMAEDVVLALFTHDPCVMDDLLTTKADC